MIKEENISEIVLTMHNLMRKILPHLKYHRIDKIAESANLSTNLTLVGLDMLVEKRLCIKEELEREFIELDKYGKRYINLQLPEIQILEKLLEKEIAYLSELDLNREIISAGIGILKKNALITIEKGESGLLLKILNKNIAKAYIETNKDILRLFEKPILKDLATKEELELYEKLKNRKRFVKITIKRDYEYIITDLGEKVLKELLTKFKDKEFIENIDKEMILNQSWKNKIFRHYELNITTSPKLVGRRHPMIEANNIIRDIFIEMGFKEMEGPLVESEFWCFDSLWIPQDHPARDEQDTFFLDGEAEVPIHVKKVKQMHENGIKKSHTSKNGFSMNITKRRILRTHSTATTFRYLYNLGKKLKEGQNINGKYFYCAHNFRNEAIDATHLPEFFQAEGFIIGDNLSLANLMSFIEEFYKKLGITKMKFKPTFNPYTEPSMEAHYYNEKLDKWYALINSGVFREETLIPIGLKNKKIIAWGMGASRLAALLSGVTNLRKLTGYTCDFEWLKNRPLMKREIVVGKK